MYIDTDIVLIDKPSGMTSFDVIRVLRKKTGIKKFGHAGTLDPLATGLMILGVNDGTKKLTEYIKLDKEYLAEIRIGERRTTSDLEGDILEEVEVLDISQSKISTAVRSLVGTLTLPVSAYSAIKVDGKPMYKRAREAEKVGELLQGVTVRSMIVYKAELKEIAFCSIKGMKKVVVKVHFRVGSGTYIRSLAEELGNRLGYPATLQALRRTKVGDFDIEDAKTLDDF